MKSSNRLLSLIVFLIVTVVATYDVSDETDLTRIDSVGPHSHFEYPNMDSDGTCNPLEDDECPFNETELENEEVFVSFSTKSAMFLASSNPGQIEYCPENNLKLTMNKRYDNPSISSAFSILYGKVEAEIKAASGSGVVSSFYLQSEDLDEIDVTEMFGGNRHQFQSNFFVKGNTSNYNRGGYHQTPSPPMDDFIKYGVEWTSESIKWMINDEIVRTVAKDNEHGYPDSPMSIKFSIWAGGDTSNEPGTVSWAGGVTNYEELPFAMYVRNLAVSDFTLGKPYTSGDGTSRDLLLDKLETGSSTKISTVSSGEGIPKHTNSGSTSDNGSKRQINSIAVSWVALLLGCIL